MPKLGDDLLSGKKKYELDEPNKPTAPEPQDDGGSYQAMPGGSPAVQTPSVLSRLYGFFTTRGSSSAIQSEKKEGGLKESLLSDAEKQADEGHEASQGGYKPPGQ